MVVAGMRDEVGRSVIRVASRLAVSYPETDLGNPPDPFDDLIYLILSGQTNESRYQATFKALQSAFPDWIELAEAETDDLAQNILEGGLAFQKARYIKEIAIRVRGDWGKLTLDGLRSLGDLECEAYLTSLPGVSVKIARCVLVYALGRDVFPAESHCLRVMTRLGWIDYDDRRAERFADRAQDVVPPALRKGLHINLIQHGRAICKKGETLCLECCLRAECPSSGQESLIRPSVVDLCCGAGGFSWGFMQAGYDIKLGVDSDPQALATFADNLRGSKTLEIDITQKTCLGTILDALSGQSPDVVIAGPPCQGFSRAGRRDPDDPRNAILEFAAQLAVKLRPKMLVFENVMNLQGPAFSRHLHKVVKIARRNGYRCDDPSVLRAEAFGVPQTRRRIVFVAAKVGSRAALIEAMRTLTQRETEPSLNVGAAFEGLGEFSAESNHEPMIHSQKVIEKIAAIKPGSGPFSYRKLDPSRLAPTLVCGHRALPCHYADNRTITVREAARLQGFPSPTT